VTTGSLDALRAYSQGERVMDVRADFPGAIPFFEQATSLDPNFAMAYGRLAHNYANNGQTAKAAENGRRAYELRQRVSERERFYIQSSYEFNVTENLEAARKTYEGWAQVYPRDDIPPNDLGIIYARLGDHEKALSAYKESLRLDPDSAIGYGNVIAAYINLNRLDEAMATIKEAQAHKLDFPNLHRCSYNLAFLQQDAAGMEREAAFLISRPGLEAPGLYTESETAAYSGQISRARELATRVIEIAKRSGRKEWAAGFEVQAALREALMGNLALARHQAEDAISLTDNKYVQAIGATVLGLTGDSAKSTQMADDLASRYPENTSMRFHYLPMIRCAVVTRKGSATQALDGTEMDERYDLSSANWMSYAKLYTVYLRGQAYLAARQPVQAEAAFQKILDHPGLVVNEPIGALAHLGLGRAYAMAGDSNQARTSYQDFLVLWKEADPGIPILQQAKAEYEKLI
jgi:tetratricopeptide (TPR) repeat protein